VNPTMSATRIGIDRGWTEFRQSLTGPDAYSFHVLLAVVILIVLWFQRHHSLPGTSLSLATVALPGVIGMLVAFNTTLSAALVVATEREDGTLLRMKAAPHGATAYVIGASVRVPLATVLGILFILIPGLILFPHLSGAGLGGWATLVWVLVLGLLATMPFGMIVGALAKDPRTPTQAAGLVGAVLIAISGIFYPISGMPGWLHPVAEVFPYYWLGLGMRSALLPGSAAHLELTGSWQHPATAGVLGAWAVVGLLLAPTVLRRMTRRESGSSVEASRQRAAQRVG